MPNARRSLRLSVPPLWLIGVCLFLPTVRACSKMESPASLLVGDKGAFVALLAPYLVAQFLAILTIVALGRDRVGRGVSIAAAALATAAAASSVMLATVFFHSRSVTESLWSLGSAAAFVAGVVVMVRARRLEPWARLVRLHAAYAIFTLPLAAFLCRIAVEDGPGKLGIGAPLFVAAVVALAALHLRPRAASLSV